MRWLTRIAIALTVCLAVAWFAACEQETIDLIDAGVENPELLTPSSSFAASAPGQTYENFSISNGTISVTADDVTLSNFYVRGNSSTSVVHIAAGVERTTIVDCEVEILPNANGKNSRGIGYLGTSTEVSECYVHGEGGDGIKVENGTPTDPSYYHHNYVNVSKTAAQAGVHLDAMQASGDSHWVAEANVLVAPAEDGGNAGLIVGTWPGPQVGNVMTTDVVFNANVLRGGNYTIFNPGGKCDTGSGQLDNGVPRCGDPASSPSPCDQPGDDQNGSYTLKVGNGIPDCWTLPELWVDDITFTNNRVIESAPGGTSGPADGCNGGPCENETAGGWRFGPALIICTDGVTYTNNATINDATNEDLQTFGC